MPTFHADQLHRIAVTLLQAAGASAEDADIVACELRDANLVGHDSHGVMRLVQYAESVRQGSIRPGGRFEVVKELPGALLTDANFNFGQVAATRALRLGVERARRDGTATVMIRNCNHVGRLGSYSQKAALCGCAAVMAVNAPGPGGVAPFGGIDRRLGTNPLSLSAPWRDSAIVLDMTTSASAEGKVRVAFQKGERLPEGWLIDAAGRPSTDPADFYAQPPGALLPLGGPLGFKGYGMAVMIDLLAGVLSGSGVCRRELPPGANGVWMYFLDVSQFLPRDEYDRLLEVYVAWIKSSRRMPGVEEILMPGEIEQRRLAERQRSGVYVPEETWRQIRETAASLGATLEPVRGC